MNTSSHCNTSRTYYPLSITRREHTALSIHVIQKITVIPAQKIVFRNLILCSGAGGREKNLNMVAQLQIIIRGIISVKFHFFSFGAVNP